MSSVIADVSDAVALALNSASPGSFSKSFTAKREYIPSVPFEEMKAAGLIVCVGPMAVEIEGMSRGGPKLYKPGVGVAVIQYVADTLNETIDPLMQLVEEIQHALQSPGVLTVNGEQVGWIGTTCDPIYRPDFLMKNTFWSVSIFTYQTAK